MLILYLPDKAIFRSEDSTTTSSTDESGESEVLFQVSSLFRPGNHVQRHVTDERSRGCPYLRP